MPRAKRAGARPRASSVTSLEFHGSYHLNWHGARVRYKAARVSASRCGLAASRGEFGCYHEVPAQNEATLSPSRETKRRQWNGSNLAPPTCESHRRTKPDAQTLKFLGSFLTGPSRRPPPGASAASRATKPPRLTVDRNHPPPLHLLNTSVRRSTIGRPRRCHLRPTRVRSARQRPNQALLPAAADDATSASFRDPHQMLGGCRQNLWTHGTWSEAERLIRSLFTRDQSNL
jgi:hypothetical protein